MPESTPTATNEFDTFDLREDLLWRWVKSNSKEYITKDTSNEVENTIARREKDMWDSL